MFIDVENAIKTALENAFTTYPEIAGNIELTIGKENVIREAPLKFPAIRILYMEADFTEENDIGGKEFIAGLEYAVILYFRSFKDKTGENVYKYLQVITEALKGIRTTKGILKPSKTRLEVANSYYAYINLFKVETVI